MRRVQQRSLIARYSRWDIQHAREGETVQFEAGKLRIIGLLNGRATVHGGNESV